VWKRHRITFEAACPPVADPAVEGQPPGREPAIRDEEIRAAGRREAVELMTGRWPPDPASNNWQEAPQGRYLRDMRLHAIGVSPAIPSATTRLDGARRRGVERKRNPPSPERRKGLWMIHIIP
jgi:hypothetical protein